MEKEEIKHDIDAISVLLLLTVELNRKYGPLADKPYDFLQRSLANLKDHSLSIANFNFEYYFTNATKDAAIALGADREVVEDLDGKKE